MILTVVYALAASFSNAVNVMTQHKASIGAPEREKGWRLVGYLFRQPLWLLGWIAAVGGFLFQALALHDGQLSVVQPLLVTELVFVLVLRRAWIRQNIARAAWASVLVVCVALAVFLTVAGALAWALMAVFIKSATDTLAAFGLGGMLTRWPVYALAAAAAAGTLLEQSALHVGPLSVSQPLLVIINPLASIVLSIWLFDERFTDSPARITIAVLSFAVLAAGVTALSRTAPQDLAPAPPEPASRDR